MKFCHNKNQKKPCQSSSLLSSSSSCIYSHNAAIKIQKAQTNKKEQRVNK